MLTRVCNAGSRRSASLPCRTPFLFRVYWPAIGIGWLLRAAVGSRRRLVIVIVVIFINLAVFRVYRITTSKLFLKPAANRLEHSSGPMNDLLTEMRNGGAISIRSFTDRSSGLLRRGIIGRITLSILILWLPAISATGRR
jgi:hypothetical protein